MRHSSIELTMSRYTHVFAGQEADAAAALPDLNPPAKQSAKATGTDNVTPGPEYDPPTRPNRTRDEKAEKNSAFYLAQKRGFQIVSVDNGHTADWVGGCRRRFRLRLPGKRNGR